MVNRVEAFFSFPTETYLNKKLKQINLHAVAVFVSLPFFLPNENLTKKKIQENSIFLQFLSIIHVLETIRVFKAKQNNQSSRGETTTSYEVTNGYLKNKHKH